MIMCFGTTYSVLVGLVYLAMGQQLSAIDFQAVAARYAEDNIVQQ